MADADRKLANKPNLTLLNNAGQLAPYSQEAEEAVLGAVMIDPDIFPNVSEFLKPEHFYILRHNYIWQAYTNLDERREKIDFVTIQDELRTMNRLKDIGGPGYLLSLSNAVPTSTHAEVYGRMVERTATRRRILTAADEMKALAMDETISLEKVVDEANRKLFEATETNAQRINTSAANVIDEYCQELESKYNGDILPGIPTGFRDLDQISGGLFRREVTLLAGPPGSGKTTLLLNIANNALALKQRVAFFSVEMGRKEAIQRFVSMEMGLPTGLLKTGRLTKQQYELFVAVSGHISTWPLHIIDEFKRLTPLQLQRRLRRLQHEQGVDLILIDGLWKMYSHRNFEGGDRAREITSIMEDLVALADQTNLPILITHQFNRESVKKVRGKKSRPELRHLSDSTGIEQNAHVIWGLYRENYSDNKEFGSDDTEVITLKARDGNYGTATLAHEKSHSRYVDKPVPLPPFRRGNEDEF